MYIDDYDDIDINYDLMIILPEQRKYDFMTIKWFIFYNESDITQMRMIGNASELTDEINLGIGTALVYDRTRVNIENVIV
jgi:hypothetical protein